VRRPEVNPTAEASRLRYNSLRGDGRWSESRSRALARRSQSHLPTENSETTMPKAEALITPEVLRWARNNVGVEIPTAAKRAGVKADAVRQWEEGATRPTVRQARLLAGLYRIPFAALFLPAAPGYRVRVPKDYRRLASTSAGEVSSTILIDVLDAWERREVVLELLEASRVAPPAFEESASLGEDPEDVGARLRNTLGISLQEQSSWRDGRRGFNEWRAHVEAKGVLVFQAADVPIEEMRAYSLAAFPLPVIVVNRKDAPQARTFSLLHEMTHLLLKSEGLCDLSTRVERPPEEQRLEVFCNAVAAACLMPAEAVKQHPIVAHASGDETWSDSDIVALARYFSVSREALLRRLLTFGLTSTRFYELKREQYRKEYEAAPKPKGFLSPPQDALAVLGRPFVWIWTSQWELIPRAFFIWSMPAPLQSFAGSTRSNTFPRCGSLLRDLLRRDAYCRSKMSSLNLPPRTTRWRNGREHTTAFSSRCRKKFSRRHERFSARTQPSWISRSASRVPTHS